MRDPMMHAEKPIGGLTHADMRAIIAAATGLACDMPKTVATGCGKRRPYVMTARVPERVTCLACRDYMAGELIRLAESAEMLIRDIPENDSVWGMTKVTPARLASAARHERALAARYSQI